MTPEELEIHINTIVSGQDAIDRRPSDTTQLIGTLSRTALGLNSAVDIIDLPQGDREELLAVMRGVRNALYPAAKQV